jgi:hypothetical protein
LRYTTTVHHLPRRKSAHAAVWCTSEPLLLACRSRGCCCRCPGCCCQNQDLCQAARIQKRTWRNAACFPTTIHLSHAIAAAGAQSRRCCQQHDACRAARTQREPVAMFHAS